jgi:hypothetical protein
MKQTYLLAMLFISAFSFAQSPIITMILDGDCAGGNPKLLEIYADGLVDFANFSIENETNANMGFGSNTSLAGLGTAQDEFVYLTTTGSAAAIASEFPSLMNANILAVGTLNVNGNDRIRIVDASMNVVDQYGVSGVDGSGENWEYADSFAKRVDGTGPDNGFTEANWTFGGNGFLNNEGTCQGGTQFETLIGGIGTYTTTASTTPTINVSGAVNDLDYFENNGPSDEGSFTVSASNLTADVVVTVPSTDFEISDTSGGTFSQSITLQQQGGDVASTTIFVRLAAGLQSAVYTEDVSLVSGGAPTQTVTVTGEVEPDTPTVFITGSADGMNYNQGNGPSSEDSFAVSGRFLTDQTITVTVTAPFEISLTTSGVFTQQVDVPVVMGAAAFEDVFIRLAAGQPTNTYSGTVTASSTGATNDTLTVTGEVFAAANCPNVGDLIITEIFANPANVNLSDGDGEYFEVYNTTGAAIDMQSFTVSDDGSDSFTVNSSVVVPAFGYVVFNRNGDTTTNGGITTDYEYGTSMSLANSADEIILICNGVEIDRVDYTGAWPIEDGIAAELSLSTLNSIDNDDMANWGEATNEFFTSNFGTPGAINDFTLSNDSLNKVSFKMYPNPATGNTLFIKSSNGASMSIAIYSTLGQQVMNKKNVSSSINISSLETGIYIVQIRQGTSLQTRKLIVE